ncbi:sugar transferase [Deinococcus sp. AJ005]|uniref:sugar transferase n=1 Tax=Deinococcus sp. AJ005 TaxID=2652443 RepID=UPI00125CCB6C|nr:glycosyltransferase [Deinococcus sp. AJ005]
MKIIYIVTIPLSAKVFLQGQLSYFRNKNYDVHLATSPSASKAIEQIAHQEGINAHSIRMQREISLFKDAASLVRMLHLMKQLRPEIVNSGTPKAGLIGSVAAALLSIPVRVYTLHGLRLDTTNGPKRILLTWMERLACVCAHRVICVSPSLRDRAIELKLVSPVKALVLASGTCNGINAQRFLPEFTSTEQLLTLKNDLALPANAPVIGFVGRFVKDKGIAELLQAFGRLHEANPRTRLLLVGDYEQGDPVAADVRHTIETHPGIVRAGFVPDTAPYYQLMDVLALPTYREGFPTAPLEAAAAAKPVVATNATGAVDAVVDGVTGFTVPVGDTGALADALRRLLEDKALARQFGQAGQERVLRDFQSQRIWEALDELYQELLAEAQARKGQRLKRSVDVAASAAGLAVLSIPMLALGLIVRLKLGSPILFSQQRPGLRGQSFTMYKFRTMRDATDSNCQPLPDSERLTPLGRFLRASSLDELPGLFNVLRGDMSLVGPRPLLMEYLERYTPTQARRHEVRPGITGWAQVNGRNAISWEEKFKLDVWYVDNRSFALDMKILWMTVQKVFKREGISAVGEATMPRFEGRPSSET